VRVGRTGLALSTAGPEVGTRHVALHHSVVLHHAANFRATSVTSGFSVYAGPKSYMATFRPKHSFFTFPLERRLISMAWSST